MTWKSDPQVRNVPEWNESTRKATWPSGLVIRQAHLSDQCYGDNCPIHNPQEHDLDHLEMVFIANSLMRVKDDGSLTPDPDDYNWNTGREIIVRNSAHCNDCGADVESESVHDFTACRCFSQDSKTGVAVDGGREYRRRLNGVNASFEDTSIVFKKELDG